MPEQGEQPNPDEFMTEERRDLIRGWADIALDVYPAWKRAIEEEASSDDQPPEAHQFYEACSQLVNLVHTPASLEALDERQLTVYKGAFVIEFFLPGTRQDDSLDQYPAFDDLCEKLKAELAKRELPALPDDVKDTQTLHKTWTNSEDYLTRLFAALPQGVLDYRQLNIDLGLTIGIPHFEAAQEMKDV